MNPSRPDGVPGSIESDLVRARSNLTHSQFSIWLGQSLHPESPLYNIPFAIHLDGRLDIPRFQLAFAAEVASNDALRTLITLKDGSPVQAVVSGEASRSVINKAKSIPLIDLRGEDAPESSASAWLNQRATERLPHDRPLWDSALLIVNDDNFIWFLNQHHLITDAWSCMRLFDRVANAYANSATELPEQGSFAAYAERELSQHAASSVREKNVDTIEADTPIFYGARPAQSGPQSVLAELPTDSESSAALAQLAHSSGMLSKELGHFCLFVVLLASLVSRTTSARRIEIGVPIHKRMDARSKQTPGLLIELHSLFVEIGEDDTFGSVLSRVQADSIQMLRRAASGTLQGTPSRSCHVVLNYFSNPQATDESAGMRMEWLHPGASDVEHKLRLHVHDYAGGGHSRLHFEFNSCVFDHDKRQQTLQHFSKILLAMTRGLDQRILQIDLLTDDERNRYLRRFNDTTQTYPDDELLALLNTPLKSSPDELAVQEGSRRLCYRELHARARDLALTLTERGVSRGTLVPILSGRRTQTLIAKLAVLLSGAAYLPLNPQEPPLRLKAILSDAGKSSFQNLGPLLSCAEIPAIESDMDRLDIDLESPYDSDVDFAVHRKPDDIAYVIYTSGSTGTPKGVAISDASLTNYLQWARNQYTDGPIVFALHSSPAVDLTITSLFLPLITGGHVEIFPEQGDSGEIPIVNVFKADNVDAVKMTPSHLGLIRELPGKCQRIRTLILGGEDLPAAAVRGVLDKFPAGTRIFNEYGPTEATVGCMLHRFDPTCDQWPSVPIGSPIANSEVYLLNEAGQPVPQGVVGEICIAGAGLAIGYLGRPEETERRFVPSALASGGRLYRSGDLGRWAFDGRLEFLGRQDEQAKIRGVRVETSEVQSAIVEHPQISDCVVILERPAAHQSIEHCNSCGIPSNHPDVQFDSKGVCSLCVAYEQFKKQAQAYFKTPQDFAELAKTIKAQATGEFDCVALFSGGKDSTYALYKLVELGLNPLAFTLDNGHVSDGAKANIERAVADLGVAHEYGSTPHMPEIFADSLARYSNVCNGCFKTIYTLSVNLARQHDIHHIVTGLSRGQIFETRLHDLFRHRIFDSATIEQQIIDARKIYHRMEDTVAKVLDVSLFADDSIYTEIGFVDFYRYWDVPLEKVYAFLRDRAPWTRPKDTGRSTNCLINDAGIYVHKKERGYHNYALPYSWDVRLGHKTREEALDELNDEIDEQRVQVILRDVGYADQQAAPSADGQHLLAFYVGDDVSAEHIREFLSTRLASEMIPSRLIRIDEIPVAGNGKLDRGKLPKSGEGFAQQNKVAPRNDLEQQLADIWQDILASGEVGIHDNFFDIGGHSLPAIQVISRVSQNFAIDLPIRTFFSAPTIASLAESVEGLIVQQIEQMSDAEVEDELSSIHGD